MLKLSKKIITQKCYTSTGLVGYKESSSATVKPPPYRPMDLKTLIHSVFHT